VEIRFCVSSKDARASLVQGLKVESPKIQIGILQFQAQLPTLSSFVSAPDQDGIAGILIGEVKEPQSLPNDKSLRYYCQAALATNVCGVSFGTQFFARIVPLDGHGDARVDALAAANLAHPDSETHVL
jgi:hypothetical protein